MSITSKSKIDKFLESYQLDQIKAQLEALPSHDRERLEQSIKELNTKTLKEQVRLISDEAKHLNPEHIAPFTEFEEVSDKYSSHGERLIKEGKVVCLLIAGGQGTRLNLSGPKGKFPITSVREKSLFQFFSEKVIAASIRYDRKLPLAIMTSDKNHDETVSFFQSNNYFGLSPNQVAFFKQDSLPLLDESGKLILDTPTSIAKGPDGNGKAVFKFLNAESTAPFLESNPIILNVILIDNPLADPYDAKLVGYHDHMKNCATVKCTYKSNPDEKVGVLGTYQKKPHIFEYSELPEKLATHSDFNLANLSLFCFSMSFLQKMDGLQKKIPLHLAWKKCPYLDKEGTQIKPEKPNAWKFEYFIFDILPYASKCSALIYPRKHCFAPLKNAQGADSPSTVKESLALYDREILEKITGLNCPKINLEISPKFYYPTTELMKKWKGKAIPTDKAYIDP